MLHTTGQHSILTGDSDDDGEPNTYDYNDSFIDDIDDGEYVMKKVAKQLKINGGIQALSSYRTWFSSSTVLGAYATKGVVPTC